MARRSTASACSRSDAIPPAPTGPSCTSNRSWTRPSCSPPVVTTSVPTSSLSRMARSRDAADDHVTHPTFRSVAVELLAVGRELDRGVDRTHEGCVDARRMTVARLGHPSLGRGEPAAGVCTEVAGPRTEAGEDARDAPQPVARAAFGGFGNFELDVVHLAR